MTTHKIYYCKLDNSGAKISREKDFFSLDDEYSFHICPVWAHKTNRTFTVRSHMNYNIFVDPSTTSIDSDFDDPTEVFFIDELADVCTEHPVIQTTNHRLFFWTESKDVWIELYDHPLTSLNNFIAIGGWWNLSNYPRGISFPFQIINPEKTVSISEGDPLFRIRFLSKNFDDGFNLVEREFDDIAKDISKEATNLTEEVRGNRNKLMNTLFKGSCPFKFFHKNDG